MPSSADAVTSSYESASPVAATHSIPLAGLLEPYGRVYPLGKEKQPLIKRIPRDLIPLNDHARIAQAIQEPERSGWGFRIESPLLVVFDCEHVYKHGIDKPGPDGSAGFERFWQAHVESLPEHLVVCSGTGGHHHYFLLPADLVPPGQGLQGGNCILSGVDLQVHSSNTILPSSQVRVPFGTGRYEVAAGLEAGIPEMPRALALALIEKQGLKPVEPSGSSKRSSRRKKTKPAANPCQEVKASDDDESSLPSPAEVQARIDFMKANNDHFSRLMNFEDPEPGHDNSPSAFLYNITKVTIYFGCSQSMSQAVVMLFCTTHNLPFKPKPWLHTYNKLWAEYQERKRNNHRADSVYLGGGEGGSRNSQVHKYPPTFPDSPLPKEERMLGQWLPLPLCPDASKQAALDREPQALASLAAQRTEFNQKFTDRPASGDWQWTRSYLIAISYYAFKVGCTADEALWYLVRFIGCHSPSFWLTPQRLATIFGLARGRSTAIRGRTDRKLQAATERTSSPPPQKSRKTRSDKGSSRLLRQVARAREKGFSQSKIAAKYGLTVETVRWYYKEIQKHGGIDAVLRPKKRQPKAVLFTNPLAEALSQMCREVGYEITVKGANSVVANVLAYVQDVGFQDVVEVVMVQCALHRPECRNTTDLTEAWKQSIANLICEQNPLVRELAVRLRDRGLSSNRSSVNGTKQRNKMKLPKTVHHASRILRQLCSGLVPEGFYPNVDVIWQYIEKSGLYWGVEDLTRKLASQWYDQQFQSDPEVLAALANRQSSFEPLASEFIEGPEAVLCAYELVPARSRYPNDLVVTGGFCGTM